jgi:colicin import membrane protein
MSWILNKKEKPDRIFFLSFALSLALHSSLILYIIISYKGENKKKEIVWVSLSFHTSEHKGVGEVEPKIKPGKEKHQEEEKIMENKSEGTKKEKKIMESKSKGTREEKQKSVNKEKLKPTKEEKNKKSGEKEKKDFVESRKVAGTQDKKEKSRRENILSQESKKSKSGGEKRDGGVNEEYGPKDLGELEKALRELVKTYTAKGEEGAGESGYSQTFISLYAQLIRESIKKNFVIPPSFKGEFLSCVVYLKIGQDGSILDMDLEESSGNRNFDIFVMKAIRNSSPFPPPPSELEIYVRFSNRD